MNVHDQRDMKLGMTSIWLGGSVSMGSFKWDNEEQTPVSPGYQNWLPGEPDNFREILTSFFRNHLNHYRPKIDEKCMVMSFMGKWSSENCNNLKQSVMCEKCLDCPGKGTFFQKIMLLLLFLLICLFGK